MLYPCSGAVRKELVERCMFLDITTRIGWTEGEIGSREIKNDKITI
jgi:hypothetical protein